MEPEDAISCSEHAIKRPYPETDRTDIQSTPFLISSSHLGLSFLKTIFSSYFPITIQFPLLTSRAMSLSSNPIHSNI